MSTVCIFQPNFHQSYHLLQSVVEAQFIDMLKLMPCAILLTVKEIWNDVGVKNVHSSRHKIHIDT